MNIEEIFVNSTNTKSAHGEDDGNTLIFIYLDGNDNPEVNLKKKRVQAERQKWENILSEKSNTFFFDSEGSDNNDT